jgi:hypothetical protein
VCRAAPAKHALLEERRAFHGSRGRPLPSVPGAGTSVRGRLREHSCRREPAPSPAVGSRMTAQAHGPEAKKALADEAERREATRKLRPRVRPLLNALLANAILALVLIGVPLFRGRTRAEASVRAFDEYTACLHGTHASESLGLSMPEGHQARFAALYLRAVPEWPATCADALARISPEPATLLLPWAKDGEEEVRAAVIGVRSAFDELVAARAEERTPQVPDRALASLSHLTAALSLLIEANGLPVDGTHEAFDLGDGLSLATPSRVPLETARGGPLLVGALPHGVRAVAADSRAIMVTRADEGAVFQVQVRRPGAARAILDDGTTTYLGWVTSETTCETDAAHCAHRLLGLARVREEGRSPSPEVWVAAHPALALSRSFALRGGRLAVLARTEARGVELRVFDLPTEWPAPVAEPTEAPLDPQVARRVVSVGTVSDAIVQDDSVAVVDPRVGVSLVGVDEGEATLVPGTEGGDTLLACGPRLLALGGGVARAISFTDARVVGNVEASPALPIHRPDPLDDTARCASSAAGTSLAWLDTRGVLRLAPDVTETRVVEAARHVAGFAIARTGETVYLASWGEDGHRDVTLARWWRGRELTHEVVTACWQNGDGFCGSAGLASDGEHVVLFARESTDLLVLAVTGAGVAPLVGLGDE